MGNFRSRSGCLTCRARRVKCDEQRPTCKACSKKNRPCQWETPQNKFRAYQPKGSSNQFDEASHSPNEGDGEAMDLEGSEGSQVTRAISPRENETSRSSQADNRSESLSASLLPSSQRSSASPFLIPELPNRPKPFSGNVPVAGLLQPHVIAGTRPYSDEPIPLTHDEAVLVNHYTEYLGRWLDCNDATRQFTLGVPEKVKHCPILCHAVLSFAARHRRDNITAAGSHQRCIQLLIVRLNEDAASHDETLLCAIVILRFYEQLNVPSSTGTDDETHMAGTSAIIRNSQGHQFLDPSAPTLREAAFWVYVRQCLYNATINQQPPNIDFSLQLHPRAESMQDSHPLARLRLETAWANQMTWNLACVVNFCFDGNDPSNKHLQKHHRWQKLWDEVQEWHHGRPKGFNSIWQGESTEEAPFPEIWFTADWHVLSFGFYHFACILLLTYKPGPKFAIRNVSNLSDIDQQILEHARLICGASKSSLGTVPLSITVCHTIFIWGPLVTSPQEQEQVLALLVQFEDTHTWPTTWIINAVRKQWGYGVDSI